MCTRSTWREQSGRDVVGTVPKSELSRELFHPVLVNRSTHFSAGRSDELGVETGGRGQDQTARQKN